MRGWRLLVPLSLALALGGVVGFHMVRCGGGGPEGAAPVAGRGGGEVGSLAFGPPAAPEPEVFERAMDIPYPAGTIRGELTLRFTDRAAYRAYLRDLRAVGLEPLGQVDELLAVRVDEAALRAVNPLRHGARPEYSHEVERPRPPGTVSPEALALLRPYGLTARSIAGGLVEGDGSGVLVGILDSGIETHPLFDEVYIVHIDLAGGGVSGPGAAHGTSVASIIAGSEGIAPMAELFVVRVLDDAGLGNSFQVAEGIVQAADMGVRVLNMSLGLYGDSGLLREAVRYAADRGVLMVAAAGNDGLDRLPYPAAYPEVLAVTAVDGTGRQALFPNRSERIDFAAPGVGVLTAAEDSGTRPFTGTSAAAPFVSGTLAALLSGNPDMTPKEAVKQLRLSRNEAGAVGADPEYGGGVLDWDRLRDRKKAGLADLALAAIHLDAEARPGTTMPVAVTVENRGTRWLSGGRVEVLVDEAPPAGFVIEALGPGQTSTRKVYARVPSARDGAALRVAARVSIEGNLADARPGNDMKAVAYRPAE